MPFLRRKPAAAAGAVPEWAKSMSAAGYAEFRGLVDGWLAGHGFQ